MFKKFVKDYFTFTSAERRGIIILLAIIILIIILRFILPSFLKHSAHQKSTFDSEVRQWLEAVTANDTIQENTHRNMSTEAVPLMLSDFNPNIISADEIGNLGVNNAARKAWINYRAKGGKFCRKEDLKRIYGLDSVTYKRLEPYIIIDTFSGVHPLGTNAIAANNLLVELNNATPAEFEYLRGIGPVFAQRICKYRSLLGGFASIGQLTEVYGMTDSLVKFNEKMLTLDKSRIKKININKADFLALSRHPYITAYEAKAILHYRKNKGSIDSLNELIINNLINDSVMVKLADYLVLDEL
jgi:competence protein ComEA